MTGIHAVSEDQKRAILREFWKLDKRAYRERLKNEIHIKQLEGTGPNET